MSLSSFSGRRATWAGAVEAIKSGWNPVLTRIGPKAPAGNRELIKIGTWGIDESLLDSGDDEHDDFHRRLRRISASRSCGANTPLLFSDLR